MVNTIYGNSYGVLAKYNKFSDTKKEQNQSTFTATLNSQPDKSNTDSIDAIVGAKNKSTKHINHDLNMDATFQLSNTALTLKTLADKFNVRNMNLNDMNQLSNELYENDLLSLDNLSPLFNESEMSKEIQESKQDILDLWEKKLELFKENSSPQSLIERAEEIIRMFKNIEALSSEPIISV